MTGIAPALALAVLLSTHASGAEVRMTLRTTYEMQCGWPGPKIAVVFPAAERIAHAAVRVNGKQPESISRSAETISITIARPPGPMCLAIAPATARIVFTNLGNPRRRGRYRIAVRHGSQTVSGAFSTR